MKIIFVFVDGLGIGGTDPSINPLRDDRFPLLSGMQREAVPLDACLGVDGLPQSATGQASLLTGANAPKAMGRHIEGFPPPALKKLIEHDNLFSQLANRGKKPVFANCYWDIDPARIPMHRRSVTTVMTLAAIGSVPGNQALLEGRAITHDITRETMHLRGYNGPVIAPETAAEHLMTVGETHDLTLFEHFLTDRAGHSGNREQVSRCLETLECFLQALSAFADRPGHLLLVSSDHGNIEDCSIRTHTRNPVPLWTKGTGADRFDNLKSLCEVTPAIVRWLSDGTGAGTPH